MRALSAVIATVLFSLTAWACPTTDEPPFCLIEEDFSRGITVPSKARDPGEFTPEGWHVRGFESKLKYDLGHHYRKGVVEFTRRGPLRQSAKHTLFSASNEESGSDGDRRGYSRSAWSTRG